MKKLLFALIVSLLISCSKNNDAPIDTTSPIISILGDVAVTITLGTPYVEEGATAEDNSDGDLSTSITVSNPVDVNILGTYTITYTVSDSSENSTMANRTVNVIPAESITTAIKYETYYDFETETICTDIDCDPNYDLIFAYGGGPVHANMWWHEQYTNMAVVSDKSFDELSFFYVSNYYFCEYINNTTACGNSSPTDFAFLYKTNEGNYFAVEFISENAADNTVTFRYKLLE